MKKTLLILCVGLSGLVCAQTAPNQNSKISRAILLPKPSNSPRAEIRSSGSNVPAKSNNSNKAAKDLKNPTMSQSVTKIKIGTAYNMFGVLTAECTQVDANQALGMISFTHRESAALTFGSGPYETDYSLDNGTTWDTATSGAGVLFKTSQSATNGTRYPNGVILNPSGNSTPANAYAITNGPHTNGSSWDSVAYGSIQLNATNPNQQEGLMYPNTVTANAFTVFTAPHFMQVTNDSIVHSVAEAWTYNSGLTATQGFYGAVINKGVWKGAMHKVIWTDTVIRPHLASYDGAGAPFDSAAEVQAVSMAWSQDGSVGYVVFFANLDSVGYNYASLQPIVYKTTNHGSTWAMMPVFNFGTIPNLVQHLTPTLDSTFMKLPFWDINGDSAGFYAGHDVDMTVDMNNNLHIFGAIESGAIANPDSGGYSYNPHVNPGRYIYDVYTTSPTGGWKANLLDSLKSPEGIDAGNTPWTSSTDGALVWGARIQASRSTDGSKLFCTWLDDYSFDGEILNPDITVIGIDAATDLKTQPTRVTSDQNNYFLQVSDIVLASGTCWDIPCEVAFDPAQNTGDGGMTPVEFMYVQGATLCDSAFNSTGVNEITEANSGFTISPNYPNPFNNTTQFNIGLTNENVVSVDVFNLFGQKVYSIPAQQMSSGNHLMTINGSGWSAGVYFYRVTVGDQSKTQKMVVQ